MALRDLLTYDAADLQRAAARVVRYRMDHAVTRSGRRQPLSQADLAHRAGISVSTLQAFENAKRNVRISQIRKIAAAIGLSVADLMAPDATAPTATPIDTSQLTPEAILIARLFAVAVTPTRQALLDRLFADFATRTDQPAQVLIAQLADLIRPVSASAASSSSDSRSQDQLRTRSAADPDYFPDGAVAGARSRNSGRR